MTESAAFAHWESLVAWWVARRNESATIGRKHPPRKQQQLEPGATPTTSNTETSPPAEPSVLNLAQQRMKDDTARSIDHHTPRQKGKVWPTPAEGGAVTETDIETMRKAYAALPPAAAAWATGIMRQGNNGHPWNKLSQVKTVRRYELYRGVLTLAQWMGDAEPICFDETIRAIVHAVTQRDIEPDNPPGQLLGTLSFGDATVFAQIAYDLATDHYTIVYDDNGTCRLELVT